MFPTIVKAIYLRHISAVLHQDQTKIQHFIPRYNPWDQRVCACPDGDFIKLYKQGKIKIITDEIQSFTETGIELKSGDVVACDNIVTATGLKLCIAGKIKISVDNKLLSLSEHFVYKGIMLSNVPNCYMFVGYTNASWTLKVDLSGKYVVKLLEYMDKKNLSIAVPELTEGDRNELKPDEVLNLESGYVIRGRDITPKQGNSSPWKLHHNVYLDKILLEHGSLTDKAMKFYSNSSLVASKI